MSSYSGSGNNSSSNYNSGYSRYNSSYNTSRTDGNTTVPTSQRPDGSYREEVRVRPGFVPEGEKQAYTPPAARTSTYNAAGSYSNISKSLSQASSEDRVDSWADEEAPILNEANKLDSNLSETKVATESLKVIDSETSQVTESAASSSSVTTETETMNCETDKVAEPRKPSQLATAIDTAIDGLNIGGTSGSDSSAARPIGRFAAQIANDEKDGRPAYRRYDGSNGYYNRDSQGYNNHREGYGYSNNNNNRDSQGYSNYGNRSSYNNWNRGNNIQSETGSQQQSETGSENRVESDFKAFLEDLSVLRREMAVINAKLEYIRYVKAHDQETLTELEAARLKLEPTLLARLDSIFESIDALAVANK